MENTLETPAATEAERKQVTVLFADLSGFTALSERLDPEDTREVMGQVFSRAAAIVARYDGRIEKFIGDAVMALFGVPAAHEDDPLRALRAAMELRAAVEELRPAIEARSGVAIALHSGVNTGVVVTGELQFDRGTAGPLGDTINLAARLMAAAPAGEIWVGAQTRRLAADWFEFDDLDDQAFKGKARPTAVARLTGLRRRDAEVTHRFRADFIGRHSELGTLLAAAEKVRDGQSQAVCACGDAGTGKTRLMSEFRSRVGADMRWLEGRAYPYAQNIPFAPLIDLLSRAWRIEDSDGPAEVRAKVLSALADLDDVPADTAPLLLHLFHLPQDPGTVIERELFQERLARAIVAIVESLARKGPTVVCLQDLHWIDQSSDALLRALVAAPPPGLMVLANFRPGYVPPPGMQVLNLTELSPRQTRELLASLLHTEPPAELAQFIAERSDGNPFYVEEVVNSLVETAVLVHRGGWELARPLSEVEVPTTVRGVISARIDRLDARRRRVLRHAAVVGREFLYDVVARVCDESEAVDVSLSELQSADLIRERQREPSLEYIFKHALTQDVAYEGLLKAERQVLHARTARVIEAVFADRLPQYVEVLAYHYLRGGVAEKAVHYLIEAGQQCVERYALAEAARHFRDAYALLEAHPDLNGRALHLGRLVCAWSYVHYYEGSIGAWRELLEKHLAEVDLCGDDGLVALYRGWLGNVRAFHGDFRGSIEALDSADALARRAGARTSLAHVTAWRSFTLFELGRLDEAIACARSLDQTPAERRAASYPWMKCQCLLAVALSVSGRLAEAGEAAAALLEFGQEAGSARMQSMGHYGFAVRALMALEFEECVARAAQGVAAARDPLFRAMNQCFLVLGLMAQLRAREALQASMAYEAQLRADENHWFLLQIESGRHGAQMALGDLSQGMRKLLGMVDEALARGMVTTGSLSECFLAWTWAGVARRDVQPALRDLLRNPWFTFTQAPWAARKARNVIARLDVMSCERGMEGSMNLVDLARGSLQVHEGQLENARKTLETIESRLALAGANTRPAALRELAEEINGCRKKKGEQAAKTEIRKKRARK